MSEVTAVQEQGQQEQFEQPDQFEQHTQEDFNGDQTNGQHEEPMNAPQSESTTIAENGTNGHAETNGTKPIEGLQPEYYRKVFVGSLSYNTTDDTFRTYFAKYGPLLDCIIMREAKTNKSRGFGFVTYDSMACVDELMKGRPHKLDNRELEIKRATPREESGKPGAEVSTQKLFIGAIKDGMTEEILKEYFGKYGKIEDCVIMKDKESNKLRGFGFVTFNDYDPVDKVVLEKFHTVGGQSVAVKKAQPKVDAGPGGNGNVNGGGMKNNNRNNNNNHQNNGNSRQHNNNNGNNNRRGGGGGGNNNNQNNNRNNFNNNNNSRNFNNSDSGQSLFGSYGNGGGMHGGGGHINGGGMGAPSLMGMNMGGGNGGGGMNQFAAFAQKMFEAMGNSGPMPTSLFGEPSIMGNIMGGYNNTRRSGEFNDFNGMGNGNGGGPGPMRGNNNNRNRNAPYNGSGNNRRGGKK